jgi:hypothetical protein
MEAPVSTPTPTPAPGSRPQDVLERVFRQLLQTFGPAVVVVLTSPTAGDARTTVVALGTVVIATAIKTLAGLKAHPGDALWKVILDRAGSAFGALLLGLGVVDWAGLISLDWDKALTAAAAAAVTAALAYFLSPPSNPPSPAPADDPAPGADVSAEDVDRAIYGDTTRPHRPGATDKW